MSQLKSYLMSMPLSDREDFAKRCETTWPFLRNVMYGQRSAGEKLCISIERESGGAVHCEDLRPDVDWAYLRGTSPELAQQEASHA